MLTDPILDAWLTAADTATRENPELADWLNDRETLIAAADEVAGFQFDPGELIIERGAQERHAWILTHGSAEVLHTAEDGTTSTVRLESAPTTLGAFGFTIGMPRGASVRALGSAIALKLDRKALSAIGSRNTAVAVGLLRWLALDVIRWLEQTRGHADPWSRSHGLTGADRHFDHLPPGRHLLDPGSDEDRRAREAVRRARFFQGATPQILLDAMPDRAHLVGVDAGSALVSDGELDRSLLILLDGKASVRNVDNQVLGRFDAASSQAAERIIGELGYLTRRGRDGTVVADTDCLLLELPHRSAPWLVHADPNFAFRLHVALLRTVCWRLREQDIERERTAAILDGDLNAWVHG